MDQCEAIINGLRLVRLRDPALEDPWEYGVPCEIAVAPTGLHVEEHQVLKVADLVPLPLQSHGGDG